MTTDRPTTEQLAADLTGDRLEQLVLENPDATRRLLDDVLDGPPLPQSRTPDAEPAPLGGNTDAVAWYYDNARTLLDAATQRYEQTGPDEIVSTMLAAANVHATLAVAVAAREQTVALWRAR